MTVTSRRCPVAVGRASEVGRVRAVLCAEDDRNGEAYVVSLSGEAGIGKTRLIEEVLDDLDGEVAVRRAGCHLADQTLPFGPFIDLASTDRDLVHLSEVLTTAGAAGADGEGAELRRRRAFDEIGRAVLDPDRPTVLVVEDVHWADEISLQALGHLTRGIETTPHRVVLTYRPRQQPIGLTTLLADLARRRVLDDIELQPLGVEEVAAMAGAMAGSVLPAEQSRRLAELSDGNPFHIEELMRATGGDLLSIDVSIPRPVEHSVASRLAGLDPTTRHAASRAAIIGRDVPVDQLAALMGWNAAETAERAAELVAAGLLMDVDGERLRFVHELARRAVEGQLLALEREAIHRELVGFLLAQPTARGGSAIDERTRADLARHAFEGRDWSAAIEHGALAAEAALGRWSATAALTHLDRVVDAAERAGTRLPTRLRLLRSRARRLLGQHAGARDDLIAAVACADPVAEPGCVWEALYELAMLDIQHSHERGADGLAEALVAARAWGDPAAIARTLNRQGNLATNRLDFDEAIDLLDEARRYAHEADDDRVIAETGVLLLVSLSLRGDPRAARRHGMEAVERLRRLDDRVGLVQALFSLSLTVGEHSYTDHNRAVATATMCEAEAREALELAESMGWTAGEALSRRALGGVLAAEDRPAEALALLRESERQATSIGHLTHTLRAKVMLGDALFDIGDTKGARRAFDEAIELGVQMGAAAPLLPCHLRQVEIDLGEGRVDDAAERLETACRRAGTTDVPLAIVATAAVSLARGEYDDALRVVERAMLDLPGATFDDPPPRLAELRAQALAGLGRLDDAAESLRDADRRARELGLRQRLRLITTTRARIAAMQGDRRTAAELAEAAWEMTTEAAEGLDPALAELLRADMERRTSSIPRRPAGLADRPGAGGIQVALTPRETEVALVVARGLTNQQIADELYISVRTAETHVKRILSKLGFSSRGQVARWVHEHGLEGG